MLGAYQKNYCRSDGGCPRCRWMYHESTGPTWGTAILANSQMSRSHTSLKGGEIVKEKARERVRGFAKVGMSTPSQLGRFHSE